MRGIPSLPGFKVHDPQQFNVADFTEDEDNVNAHSEVDLTATGNSLDQFGQVENLVVDLKNKKVIGGNGRLRKMKEKGWDKFWGQAVEGGEDQIRTLAITLNKTGRNSDFDYSKLTVALQELQNVDDGNLLALTGFQEHELAPLLSAEMHLPEAEDNATNVPPEKAKGDKDLDSRGITIQFSLSQKPFIDQALNKLRTEMSDFSVAPAECLAIICEKFVNNKLDQEE